MRQRNYKECERPGCENTFYSPPSWNKRFCSTRCSGENQRGRTFRQKRGLDTKEKVMDYIIRHKREHDGVPPSLREISATVHRGHPSVVRALYKLRDEGRISWDENRERFIQVTGGKWEMTGEQP